MTAPGRTNTLLTLRGVDVRAARDNDRPSVRPARRQGCGLTMCLLSSGDGELAALAFDLIARRRSQRYAA